jgi:hypothetical protein
MHDATLQAPTQRSRWFHAPVVWLFLSLLGVTILASVGLLYTAATTFDGLVDDDYYKQGNAINMGLKRDQRAVTLGVRAQVMLGDDARTVSVLLTPMTVQPPTLKLSIVHPTRQGQDRVLTLQRAADGLYTGVLPRALPRQRWLMELEPPGDAWRLHTEARLVGAGGSVRLVPQVPGTTAQ